jgi:signal transduction histidine kinase
MTPLIYANLTRFFFASIFHIGVEFSYLTVIGLLLFVILFLIKQLHDIKLQLETKKNEVEELSNFKTVCLQAVAHDLRTSMMGMLMILRSLQNRPNEPILLSRPILECMIKSSDRALTLINAVSEGLDCNYSQIDLRLQPTALPELVTDSLTKLNKRGLVDQIVINNLVTENLPQVKADPEQIQRVLEHLILNAIQHNPTQSTIALNAKTNGNKVRFIIEDNGIGMTPKQCQSLFKIYVRNLYNSRLTGIGLGLYVCHRIIKAHRGEIGVNSQPNRGTRVWFTLPLAVADNCKQEVLQDY